MQQFINVLGKQHATGQATALLGMAEAAETNRLQTLYVDAQRLIRGRRGEIEAGVTEAVLASFTALDPNATNNTNGVRETSTRNTPYNHFELLGNEDLERGRRGR